MSVVVGGGGGGGDGDGDGVKNGKGGKARGSRKKTLIFFSDA